MTGTPATFAIQLTAQEGELVQMALRIAADQLAIGPHSTSADLVQAVQASDAMRRLLPSFTP